MSSLSSSSHSASLLSSVQPKHVPSSFSRKTVICFIFLIVFSVYNIKTAHESLADSRSLPHPDHPSWQINNLRQHQTTATQTNVLIAGMSFTDATISDTALDFITRCACYHNIISHILLVERDVEYSLEQRIAKIKYQFLNKTIMAHPNDCQDQIYISVSPSDHQLLQVAQNYYKNDTALSKLHDHSPNNPLDTTSRIARIKRSRQYQREQLQMLSNMKKNEKPNRDDESGGEGWGKNAIVALMDLDMDEYPSPMDVIDTAQQYILPSLHDQNGEGGGDNASHNSSSSSSNKFHAVCANGKVSKERLRYYDTFATVLLPDIFLRSPQRPKPQRPKEDRDIIKKFENIVNSNFQFQAQQMSQSSNSGDDSETRKLMDEQPIAVRSCFNGLTLYRADVWMQSKCRYDDYHEDDLVFMGRHLNHTCEHVVFHQCLRRTMPKDDGGWSIAVKPDLVTTWHGQKAKE